MKFDEDDAREQFVSYLNITRNQKYLESRLHLFSTFVLDVGDNYTRIIKGVERQLRIEKIFIDKRTAHLV